MEWVILIGVLAVSGLGWAGVMHDRRENRNDFYAEVAHRLGSLPPGWRSRIRIGGTGLALFTRGSAVRGTVDGKKFAIRGFQGIEKGNDRVSIILSHKLPFPMKLFMSGETSVSKMKKKVGWEDILTGDDVFDGKMLLRCDIPAAIRAMLDRKTRSDILDLLNSQVEFFITHEGVSIVLDVLVAAKIAKTAVDRLKKIADVSAALTDTRSVSWRLVEILLGDDEPAVRVLCIRDLALMEDDTGVIREAMRRASMDALSHSAMRSSRRLISEGRSCASVASCARSIDGARSCRTTMMPQTARSTPPSARITEEATSGATAPP